MKWFGVLTSLAITSAMASSAWSHTIALKQSVVSLGHLERVHVVLSSNECLDVIDHRVFLINETPSSSCTKQKDYVLINSTPTPQTYSYYYDSNRVHFQQTQLASATKINPSKLQAESEGQIQQLGFAVDKTDGSFDSDYFRVNVEFIQQGETWVRWRYVFAYDYETGKQMNVTKTVIDYEY